jgi:hypothetical protein
VEQYQNHLDAIDETVKSIMKIVQATEEANEIVALLNVMILNSEYRVKLLPPHLRDKRTYLINKLHQKVNILIERFDGEHAKVSDEQLEKLRNFRDNKVTKL